MNRHYRGKQLGKILTEDILILEYVVNKLSTWVIADKYSCSKSYILKYLNKYNIQRRNKSEALKGHLVSDKTKKKSSLSHMGHPSPFKGMKNRYTPEVLEKITMANRKNARKGEFHHNWINGISKHGYPHTFSKELKEFIRKRDGFMCYHCDLQQKDCKNQLHVHHIDYNKRNGSKTNLITLCQSCHMKTNFNRDYWFAYYTYIMETHTKEK